MIISHDLGTTGDKATLVSNDGKLIAAVTASYPTDFGPRGKAEQDAEHWWTALCTATKGLLDRAAVRPEDIDVVSFSGQMMGAVLLDAAGEPVRPAIIWADTRSGAQCSTLIERVGMARGYAITGHRLNPTYSLTKVMWVRDTEPDAGVVPTILPGFTDSRTWRAAFPNCIAYGFFPHAHMTLFETWPLMHSNDERIDVGDLGFATEFFAQLPAKLLS